MAYRIKVTDCLTIIVGGRDSLRRICEDLHDIQQRLGRISTKRSSRITRNQQEVIDMEHLLKETKERVTVENAKHSGVINTASSIKTSIKIPAEIEE